MAAKWAKICCALAITARSASSMGAKEAKVARLSCIWAVSDMPDSTASTPSQAGGEPQRPGRVRRAGPGGVEQGFHLLRRVGQGPSLDRLHDDDLFAVAAGDLIVFPRGHLGVLPVGIVDLQLDDVHAGVLGQQAVQQGRGAVERKAVVADAARGLLLLDKVPQAPLGVVPGVGVLHGVEQVVVEIACAGAGQALLQLAVGILDVLRDTGVQLGGKGIAFPRVALDQGFAGGSSLPL